jgi:hypothetical protein
MPPSQGQQVSDRSVACAENLALFAKPVTRWRDRLFVTIASRNRNTATPVILLGFSRA